ncbi:MAG: carboxymuconolactone decarboxylase family protein [Vicinamibacterales bacterium]
MDAWTLRTLPVTVVVLAIGAAVAAAQTSIEPPGARRPAPAAQRVAPLPQAEWNDAQKALVEKYARYGAPDNAARTLLRVPELFDGVMPYTIYLAEDSSLSPRQRELLILRAAWLGGNQWLWSRHAPRARKSGMSDADLHRIAEGGAAKGWDPLESALLRMADELFRNQSVTDATWGAVSKTFDLFHMMDAVETVNHFVVLSLIFNSYGVQPEAAAKDRIPSDVPYAVNVPKREPPLAAPRAVAPPGPGIAVGRTFGLYPTLSRAWSPRQTFILQKSPLTPRHREMLILRMGWNCRSEYEWSQHVGRVGRAREWGLEPKWIALGPEAPGWEPIERTILKASDELFRDSVVSNDTWRALVDRFGVPWVMSAIFTTSDYGAISRSLNAYGVPHEPDDERFPVL